MVISCKLVSSTDCFVDFIFPSAEEHRYDVTVEYFISLFVTRWWHRYLSSANASEFNASYSTQFDSNQFRFWVRTYFSAVII